MKFTRSSFGHRPLAARASTRAWFPLFPGAPAESLVEARRRTPRPQSTQQYGPFFWVLRCVSRVLGCCLKCFSSFSRILGRLFAYCWGPSRVWWASGSVSKLDLSVCAASMQRPYSTCEVLRLPASPLYAMGQVRRSQHVDSHLQTRLSLLTFLQLPGKMPEGTKAGRELILKQLAAADGWLPCRTVPNRPHLSVLAGITNGELEYARIHTRIP